jgi:hypothetical protein
LAVEGRIIQVIAQAIDTPVGNWLICKIFGFHGGDDEESRLIWMWRRIGFHKHEVSEESVASNFKVTSLIFQPEDVDDTLILNGRSNKTHMLPQTRTRHYS